MKDNNINSDVKVIGFVNPTNMESEFKKLKYSESDCFGDRTISVSEIENGYIHIDCIKGEKQIRTSMTVEDDGHSLAISIRGKNVSDKKVKKIASSVSSFQNDVDMSDLRKLVNVIITSMIEIDL